MIEIYEDLKLTRVYKIRRWRYYGITTLLELYERQKVIRRRYTSASDNADEIIEQWTKEFK